MEDLQLSNSGGWTEQPACDGPQDDMLQSLHCMWSSTAESPPPPPPPHPPGTAPPAPSPLTTVSVPELVSA